MKKKATKEERREIVAYCLEHKKNYKETAEKYVPYFFLLMKNEEARQ